MNTNFALAFFSNSCIFSGLLWSQWTPVCRDCCRRTVRRSSKEGPVFFFTDSFTKLRIALWILALPPSAICMRPSVVSSIPKSEFRQSLWSDGVWRFKSWLRTQQKHDFALASYEYLPKRPTSLVIGRILRTFLQFNGYRTKNAFADHTVPTVIPFLLLLLFITFSKKK